MATHVPASVRNLVALRSHALSLRPFSSTASVSAPPPKKSGAGKPTLWKKKGTAGDEDATAGGQGLGNVLDEVTQAPPDQSQLPVLQPETLTAAAVGEVRAFSSASLAAFKTLKIPPLLEKEFSHTRRPATVVRGVTLQTTDLLDASRTTPSKDSRHVLVGPVGSGKSVLMLQALSYAQSTGWIVLYLPSAVPLVDSSTPHVYSASQALFDQPLLALELLTRFASVNKSAFKTLRTRKERTFGDRTVAVGQTLEELATRGVDDKTSTAVLEAILDELSAQSSHPVLLAVDDVQSLFATSSYVDPTYNAVESFSLAVPRMLLEYVSGARSFTAGSVLLAPSHLSARSSPAMAKFLNNTAAPTPYKPVGSAFESYEDVLAGLGRIALPPRLERKEAVGIVRMIQGWRGVREVVSDQAFLERYVATDGVPRDFVRSLDRNREV